MDFPKLSTGAVQQYPARRAVQFATEVMRFVDGSEQRFRSRGSALHEWRIQLDLLSEQEMYLMHQFFEDAKGRQGVFRFQDPWDGTIYPNCSLDNDTFEWMTSGELRGALALVVKENP